MPRTRVSGSRLLVGAFLAFALLAMLWADRRTSTTFDEIVLVSMGARSLETGDWTMFQEQPPVMLGLYGLPVWLSGPVYPTETGSLTYGDHWGYARDFYFRVGNDPRRVALLSRAVAMAVALGLILAVYLFTASVAGIWPGVLAAGLTAFLPDVLAHGAVAYNDVPMALAYLLAVWALDRAVRRPGPRSGMLGGAAVALALGVKFSAVALGPVALCLVLAEALFRRVESRSTEAATAPRGWGWGLAVATGAGLLAAYGLMVLLYRGDPTLAGLQEGLRITLRHAEEGHPGYAYLLGEKTLTGWWYFFPVAFFFKTPAALHLLLPVAAWGLLAGGHARAGGGVRPAVDLVGRAAGSRLRAPFFACAVFFLMLIPSELNVGFRYVLPALPPLLILVAVGVSRVWRRAGPRVRMGCSVLVVLYAGSTLSVTPHHLGYVSEWGRPLGPGRAPLLDSSVEWGQGLVELNDFMREEGVRRIRLSYFGSALPEAYGIEYEPLPSFFPLPGRREPDAPSPAYTVISATNLAGLYVEFPGLEHYRGRAPDHVLPGYLYVYRD